MAARKKYRAPCKGLKLSRGKGIMDKFGKEPFALCTIHTVQIQESPNTGQTARWVHPLPFTMESLFAALIDPNVVEVEVIDEQNRKFTLEIAR